MLDEIRGIGSGDGKGRGIDLGDGESIGSISFGNDPGPSDAVRVQTVLEDVRERFYRIWDPASSSTTEAFRKAWEWLQRTQLSETDRLRVFERLAQDIAPAAVARLLGAVVDIPEPSEPRLVDPELDALKASPIPVNPRIEFQKDVEDAAILASEVGNQVASWILTIKEITSSRRFREVMDSIRRFFPSLLDDPGVRAAIQDAKSRLGIDQGGGILAALVVLAVLASR